MSEIGGRALRTIPEVPNEEAAAQAALQQVAEPSRAAVGHEIMPAVAKLIDSAISAVGKLPALAQGRAVSLTVGLPGSTISVERPRQKTPARGEPYATPLHPDPVIAECMEIARSAGEILARMEAPGHGINDQPGGATRLEKVLQYLPGMNPRPMQAMRTFGKRPLTAKQAAKTGSTMTSEGLTSLQSNLIEEVAARADVYHEAAEDLDAAQTRLGAAQAEVAENLAESSRIDGEIAGRAERITVHEQNITRMEDQIAAMERRFAVEPSFSVTRQTLAHSGDRQALGTELKSLRQDLEGEERDQQAARQHQAQLRNALPGLQTAVAAAGASVDQHRDQLLKATSQLHNVVNVTNLHDVAGAVLTATLARKHIEFVHDELDRFKAKLDAHKANAESDITSVRAILEGQRSARLHLASGLEKISTNIDVQRDQVARLTQELFQANTELTKAHAQPAPASEAAEHAQNIAKLHEHIEFTQSALAGAEKNIKEAEAQIVNLQDHAAMIDEHMAGLKKMETAADEQKRTAILTQRGLDSPLEAAKLKRDAAVKQHEESQAAYETLEAHYISNMLKQPPGFAPSAATAALSNALKEMVKTWPANESPDAVPKIAVAEITSMALAQVTDGNAERAGTLLGVMRSTPTKNFIARTGDAPTPAGQGTPDDVKALFRLMAPVPRGAELLQMMGRNGGELMDSKSLAALRVYWQADAAIAAEPSPSVGAWLKGAQEVASERLHWQPPVQTDDAIEPSVDGTSGAAEQAVGEITEEIAPSVAGTSGAAEQAVGEITEEITPSGVGTNGAAEQPAGEIAEEIEPLDKHLGEMFDEPTLGAYNAVRNNLLSNAPGSDYDLHNQRYLKMLNEWVQRSDDRFAEGILAGLSPLRAKTAFKPQGLKNGAALAEKYGMTTHRTLADRAIKDAAGDLATVALSLTRDGRPRTPEENTLNIAVAIAAKYINKRNVDHDSDQELTKKDFKAIFKQFKQATNATNEPPPSLRSLAADAKANGIATASLPLWSSNYGVPASEVILTLCEDLARTNGQHLSPELHKALAGGMGLDAAKEHFARSHEFRFHDKRDILKYFRPMVTSAHLRDRVRVEGGGSLGVGIPSSPYEPAHGLVTANAGVSRRESVYVEFFYPILGFQWTTGTSKGIAGDASVGIGDLWYTGKGKTGASATLRGVASDMDLEGTVVRFLRTRGQDEKQLKNMDTALESVVLWDELPPKNRPAGEKFAGPVEALLSRSPDAVLTSFEATSELRAVEAGLTATTRDREATGAGTQLGGGLTLGGTLRAERTLDMRSETAAAVNVIRDKSSTAKQTLSVTATGLVPAPEDARSYKTSTKGNPTGSLSGGNVPVTGAATREVLQHLIRHGLSPFRINNKQDGDIDRHYNTPREMLAEIQVNREQWLSRCLETLPEVDGTKDTPENRAEANRLLDKFIKDIKFLKKNTEFCQYNVNYSMRPQASAWIDSMRAICDLSQKLGDGTKAGQSAQAADEVLQHDATWRPLMLIVRERGSENYEPGINYVIRSSWFSNVQAQRTAAQYPPP